MNISPKRAAMPPPETPRRHTNSHENAARTYTQPQTPRARAMGLRVVCATPHRGTHAVDNYSLGDRLGKGAFATVFKGIHLRTAEVVAIKQIPLDKIKAVDSVMSEIELLQNLQHPNIVKYLGFMKDDSCLNIVLEYCENGSLAMICRKFGSFPENLVAMYMRQVLEGLVYLHDQGTIHRDIKGANILTTKDGVAKLADFGVATRAVIRTADAEDAEDAHRPGVVGTPHWMAPEIISMHEPTPACDIWSLGATVVELRTGQPPYGHLSDISAMYAIVQEDSAQIIPSESSGSLRDFLGLCFDKNSALRVPAAKLLAHRWIQKFGGGAGNAQGRQTVEEFRSPARKKRLAVPSRLNLRGLFEGNVEEDASGSFEEAFITLGVFGPANGSPNAHEESGSPRGRGKQPRTSALLDIDDKVKDGRLAPPDDIRRPLETFIESSGADGHDSDFLDEAVVLKPRSPQIVGDEDPFDGLDDLLEDAPDERVVAAVEEAEKLAAGLERTPVRHLKLVYLRFGELLAAAGAGVKRTLHQQRVLQRSLALLTDTPSVSTLCVYLDVVAVILTSEGHTASTSFWLAGGLSFVLRQASQVDDLALRRRVLGLLALWSAHNELALQLAFREDSLAFICGWFHEDSSTSDLSQAADLALALFNACGPRHRADLWHHLAAYGLVGSIADLLHRDQLAQDSRLRESMYMLVSSFQRCPPGLVGTYATRPVLRRLMRAYLLLPSSSPHRTTILQFFKDVSTLPSVLEAMHRGGVVPHLIHALRKALRDGVASAANCLVPTFYNYSRLGRARQREVAEHGLLPLLHETAAQFPALREFSWPIFCVLAHSGHPQCLGALWKADGLGVIVHLLTEPGWEGAALAALGAWLDSQETLVRSRFAELNGISAVVTALAAASRDAFEPVLTAATGVLDRHRVLCADVDATKLFEALAIHVDSASVVSNTLLVQVLQLVTGVLALQPTAANALESVGLGNAIRRLLSTSGGREVPVLAQTLASRLPQSGHG